MLTGEPCWGPTRFSLAEILVLAGTAGAGGMAPPTSTRISARMKSGQGHGSAVAMLAQEDAARGGKGFVRLARPALGPSLPHPISQSKPHFAPC